MDSQVTVEALTSSKSEAVNRVAEVAEAVHGLQGRKRLQKNLTENVEEGNPALTALAFPTDAKDIDGALAAINGNERVSPRSVHRPADPNWMDAARENVQSYEYLCHVGEAKEWIEACIGESIMPIVEMDEGMRNGIVLARLGKHFEPTAVKKVFEAEKLQWRHSDNIIYFLDACRKAALPEIFYFEMTDLYDRKNIPKVIYCIHALAHYLHRQGRAPRIGNLVGQLEFTDAELNAAQEGLDAAGVTLPHFGDIGHALAKELKEDPPGPTEEELRQMEEEAQRKREAEEKAERQRLEEERLRKEQEEEERKARHLQEHLDQIVHLQSVWRGRQARLAFQAEKDRFAPLAPVALAIQSLYRGNEARAKAQALREEKRRLDEAAVKLQSLLRGQAVRRQHQAMLAHYKAHEAEITKVQAIWRARKAKAVYLSLTTQDDAPISALQNFVHLLDDSDLDFQEELELSNLRQKAIKQIRDNASSETAVNDLDVKIALLVKNRITLDEVVRSTKRKAPDTLDAQSPAMMLRAVDKESRQRLEAYQNLFYLLQTEPRYLTKLILTMKRAKLSGFVETMVLTLFGYAQNPREEYLLLRLFKNAIADEVDNLSGLNDFLKSSPVFIRLVVHYNRGAKERAFLRDLLQPLVKSVLEDDGLDLETDPLNIYRGLIRDEESRTGAKSQRSYDITREQALAEADVKAVFIQRLQRLGSITETFLTRIIAALPNLPYGIRYIAKELRSSLKQKFPQEEDAKITKVLGHLIYYRYMNPAIVAPEGFDVIESIVNPVQRKNLAEVSRVLQQVAADRLFEDEAVYLQPLNPYVTSAAPRMLAFFNDAADCNAPEVQFNMDEWADASRTSRPVVYLSPTEIFLTHALCQEHLDDLAPQQEDAMRVILQELGTAPAGYSSSMENVNKAPGNEMALTLTSRFKVVEDSDAGLRNLFVETKRCVLTIIRCQTGKNLLDILERPVTSVEEEKYQAVKQAEHVLIASRQQEQSPKQASDASISFAEFKNNALVNMATLEEGKKVSRANYYQDMLNAIAKDIRNKHRRRIVRKTELKNVKGTIQSLDAKAQYLDDQKKSYHDYIDACTAQLSMKKGKKPNNPALFSKQWSHMRQLKQSGKIPKFGSYKYGADKLYEKGVLESIEGYSPKQYDKISLTVSSDEAGVFLVQVALLGIKTPHSMEIKLDDLLQAQYDHVQTMELFGIAKVNVNLLLFLINKKFFA